MANYIQGYELGTNRQCTVVMPKRARVMSVGHSQSGNVVLFAVVSHDADTRAFDPGGYQRHFLIVGPNEEVPADGQLVGMSQYQKPTKPMLYRFVYEVSGVRGSR